MRNATRHRTRRNGAQLNHRVDEFRDHANAMGVAIKDMAATAGAAAGDQMDPIAAYIREKPWQATLIAAGAGAVLGMILSRRH